MLPQSSHCKTGSSRRPARTRGLSSVWRTAASIPAGLVLAVTLATLASPAALHSQPQPSATGRGTVIPNIGKAFVVEQPTFAVPAGHLFKAVFDISTGSGDSLKVNEQLMTVGRFHNIHAENGIDARNVRTAAVVHGSGWPAILNDAAFAARFGGKPNPSRALVEALLQRGGIVVLCGQTAGARGVRREELLPGVQLAISAMTALNVLQADGYRMNPW